MVSSHDHLVYVEGADARRLLRTALEGCSAVGVATDWEAFVHEFANVRSAAVCLLDLNGHSAERLRRLRAERPLVPLALVTDLSPSNLKAMNQLPEYDEILLSDEISNLPDVLDRIASRSLLLEAAALIESLDVYPPELVATLARACRRPKLVRSVTKLAEEVLGADRQAFWRSWRASARCHA